VVLDVAYGLGEFSRNIKAGQIIGVALNPDAANFLPARARFHLGSAERPDFLADATIDVAFASNFLEHMPLKASVDAVLRELRRVLRPGGRFVVLHPNIKF
jgi:ubiquinone/menaquinone biosynthesis C-methylase UbiE